MRGMTAGLRQPQGNAVGASPVASASASSVVRGIVIATIGALFMAFVGAVGTDEAPLGRRLLYWLAVMEAGALLGALVSISVHAWGRLRGWPVVEGGLVALLITLPLTTVVITANHLFFGGGFPHWSGMLMVGGVVFMVSTVITAINYATAPVVVAPSADPVPLADAAPLARAETMPEPAPVSASATRLAERLKPHLRQARLLALEAEDHYLRVHTDAGSDLVLMRLGDAVAELDGLPGARTHRSWWVARAAVEASSTDKGRTLLYLPGGLVVPVSRSYRPELQAGGWMG
ncbi:MAG: LytTR family DNA-binding domain-containing protein [Polymorphobacter sp.]